MDEMTRLPSTPMSSAATTTPSAPVAPTVPSPSIPAELPTPFSAPLPLPLPPTGVAALVRFAVVSIDPDGRIAYWNRGAEELFGHRWEAVFGHRAAGLLYTPAHAPSAVPALTPPPAPGQLPPPHSPGAQRDVFDLLDDLTRPSWTGAFSVADRDGRPRDALWWSYRIVEPAGRSLLVLAANAKPLRSGALRIAVGDRLLPYALVGAPGPAGVRVVPHLGPPATMPTAAGPLPDDPAARIVGAMPDPEALAARLSTVLPRINRGRLERTMRQVARLGYPAIEVEGAAPLPVLPYEAVQPDGMTAPDRAAGTAQTPGAPGLDRPEPRGRVELLPAARDIPPAPLPRPPAALPPGSPSSVPVPVAPDGIDPPDAAHPTLPSGLTPIEDFPSAPGHLVQQQLALLRETGTRVGTTLELDTTAAELCRVAVPRFADFASVMIVDDVFSDGASPDTEPDGGFGAYPAGERKPPDGPFTRKSITVRRIAAANRHPDSPWDRVLAEGELFTLPAERSPGLREPLLLPVVDPALAYDLADDLGVPAIGPLLPGRSLLITPLTARGTVLGRMCFVREPERRPFTAKDAATAVELAARGAVHLDNARLHRFESRAAATLQRSMLPTSPPRIPGVRIAHHYRPGDRQAQVGGDWFDAIQLPGGRVALIVGDVMGHGLLSAAVMGQFRTAVQTMAALDLPPAQLLRHLDNLAHRLGADHLATCVYTVYDAIHRTLTLANAGHIPPVLARHDGRSELLRIPEGAPIGVGGVPFETVEIPVPDGSWLVLCTDGLVEVRGQGIDAGLAALCANVIEPQQTPEDVCDQILSRVHSEDRRDDVALLVARFEGIAPQDVAEWRLPLDPCEVRTARAVTREQLAAWDLGQLSDLAELLVSELVTNALRVASHEVSLRLMRVGKLLVEVSDDDHNLPQLRRADEDDEHGRGLALVSNLSPRWGTARRPVGKVVWFELALPMT